MSWVYGFASKNEDIREIEVLSDGLLFRSSFNTVKDLLELRPTARNGMNRTWYFNESRDRKIATLDKPDETVTFNPQLLWSAGFEIVT